MDYALLNGKNVLITGGSRGIGRQIALSLADKECNLFIHSRNHRHTQEIEQILLERGASVRILEADLADPEAAEKMAFQAEKISNGIDIVFNNAAINTPWHNDFNAPIEDYLMSFKVNVISLIKICDVILPAMLKRGFGRIVNVTSCIQDEPERTPYAISKAAVDKYVKDMAIKLKGTNVLMNLMNPGWIRTDMGGPKSPNEIESVIPGALIPALLGKEAGSGRLYQALDYQ